MKISRILHAGYVFEYQDFKIAFDPIFENPFSRNCYAFPDVTFDYSQIKKLNFSAIFISHFHDDHCSLESLNYLNREIPIYIYCIYPDIFTLLKELGFKNVYPLHIDAQVQVGPFLVTPRKALDEDVDSIFHVQLGSLHVLNVVDSWIDPETLQKLKSFAPWDLILWPFQTMREIEVLSPNRVSWSTSEIPEEWSEQLQILRPKYLVPSSCQFIQENWSWYNQAMFPISYSQFQEWIKSILPFTKVVRMNPSTSFVLDSEDLIESTPLNWVLPRGDQNVDYSHSNNVQIPTVASIAQKFNGLDDIQIERVLWFCRQGILDKYQSLECSTESYFFNLRIWRLTVYDSHGLATHFYYELRGKSISLIQPCDQNNLAWTTEVPMAKLYAALDHGESLTSMYVRINGQFFTDEVEKQLRSVDILEDPLLRCLFSSDPLLYQKDQLKRIKKDSALFS